MSIIVDNHIQNDLSVNGPLSLLLNIHTNFLKFIKKMSTFQYGKEA